MKRTLLIIALALAALPSLAGNVRTISPTQQLLAPDPNYSFFGQAVAIDGGWAIVLADRPGGRVALLYGRESTGRWAYRRVLLDVADTPENLRAGLEMKNGIAAVQLNATIAIFELINSEWQRATTLAPLRYPGGLAISGNRILIGGSRCETYSGYIYQRGANGIWGITGRLPFLGGPCSSPPLEVELNYDYALVRVATRFATVYRPTSSLDWASVGSIQIPEEASTAGGPLALQKSTAVSPGSAIFRRTGTAWNHVGQLQPVDYGNGTGHAGAVEYRDGVLIASEGWSELHQYTKPYLYLENAGGTFEHVGILETSGFTQDFEISNSTVFASFDLLGETGVDVFTLPSPLRPARSITNDFNARDVSGFEQTAGSQFALAGNVSNYLYRQSATAGESVAVLADSDWNHYQSIEADITPTAFDGADRYVGLAVRYVDIANNYYVTWRSSNVIQLKRKVNGAFVTLAERALPLALNTRHHVRLSVAGSRLAVEVDGNQVLTANDTTFSRGRAALLTYRARADFDNVYASPTAPLNVNFNDWVFYWFGFGRPFTELGGQWEITGQQDPEGMSQTTTTGLALAYNGVATENQVITANMRLDSFAAPSGAWFGLLARYVDEQNHYFLSVRSSNQLQIRKIVNGVTTVLKAVSFTAAPGAMHEYTFSVVGNELHAIVDGQLVATALDGELPRGKYGMGTYRAAATWQDFLVTQ
ncbi:MAG TPA: hypothetical protein VFU13_05185 [Steroidobacteraceae bacterium]|nr:hypothetical protein [Steroidobacteraceae bacterium]